MAALSRENIIGKYKAESKTVNVKAWGGDVVIRKLRVAEANAVQAVMLKDMELTDVKDSKVEVSIGRANEAAILAVSFALVEPKLTVKDLNELPADAMEGVTQIKDALDNWDKPKKSTARAKGSSD